ncbi:glucosidase [bacterium]|nr:glucosidase [bacterium]
MNLEQQRLAEAKGNSKSWRKWGPYLSERQWGTVREDYSPGGEAWEFLDHDASRSRAYRWGEDGIAGYSDDHQRLCFSIGMWNGRDAILKERMFGLTGNQGNHGEDVKEHYYYLDATPSHSYLKMLYKYPQAAYPYSDLVSKNNAAGKDKDEYELLDTGIFDEDRYFDVFVEYVKASPTDTLIRVTVHNRGPEAAEFDLLAQLCFRNTWSWGRNDDPKPTMTLQQQGHVDAEHPELGNYRFAARNEAKFLFCENDTNAKRVFGMKDAKGFFKDAFHEAIVDKKSDAVNPDETGTKCAAHEKVSIDAGEHKVFDFRLFAAEEERSFEDFDEVFDKELANANQYYDELQTDVDSADQRLVQRQAYAGLIWTKQFYHFDVEQWLEGDPDQPKPPESRKEGRNKDWKHLNNADIISMPDKWEYPWYAAWDLAFHCIPLATLDPQFAKDQLVLMTREWYMHPNGQMPAYEWAFGDVNPPVHAWAAWRVYQMEKQQTGTADRDFLEGIFHKLLLNFTWWINRKDVDGNNVFQGGFLGLDNIGVFDRSAPMPGGGHIDQSDGTSWMGMYSLNMLRIALELALENPVYEDIATKFFEHFLYIAEALNSTGGTGNGLWDEEDGFYYDALQLPSGDEIPLKVRSLVGLAPLFAVETLEPELLEKLPNFTRRMDWFLTNKPHLADLVSHWSEPGKGDRRLLSLLRGHRMKCLLKRMLDETEFLSDYGIRAISKFHEANPFELKCDGEAVPCGGGSAVKYEPAESRTTMFGGNSNWRGPIWFPMNFLLIESMNKFHRYYGDDFKIECPVGSGQMVTISDAADQVSKRLTEIFVEDEAGERAVFNKYPKLQNDPHFKDYIWFYEYFHGDNGRGVGATHQTGWTALVATLLQPKTKM